MNVEDVGYSRGRIRFSPLLGSPYPVSGVALGRRGTLPLAPSTLQFRSETPVRICHAPPNLPSTSSILGHLDSTGNYNIGLLDESLRLRPKGAGSWHATLAVWLSLSLSLSLSYSRSLLPTSPPFPRCSRSLSFSPRVPAYPPSVSGGTCNRAKPLGTYSTCCEARSVTWAADLFKSWLRLAALALFASLVRIPTESQPPFNPSTLNFNLSRDIEKRNWSLQELTVSPIQYIRYANVFTALDSHSIWIEYRYDKLSGSLYVNLWYPVDFEQWTPNSALYRYSHLRVFLGNNSDKTDYLLQCGINNINLGFLPRPEIIVFLQEKCEICVSSE